MPESALVASDPRWSAPGSTARAESIRDQLRTAAEQERTCQTRVRSALDEMCTAITSEDHLELGYRSVSDYVQNEFSEALWGLPIDIRREVIQVLSPFGVSTRALSTALDVSQRTVVRGLPSFHLNHDDSGENAPVVGLNGKDQSGARREAAREALLAHPDAKLSDLSNQTGVSIATLSRARADLGKAPPPKEKLGREARLKQITALAGGGMTSQQIAAEIGVGPERVRLLARRAGVKITADAVMHHQRRHDSNRIAANTANALEGLTLGIALINFDDLDPEEAGHWATSLTASLQVLNRFTKKIKEVAQ